ncbi:MAG TPA: UDP-4-amino-4,6-dideoxy-N-acetyl-beta-L-altrosamine N-acetyltransferase, partial [Aliarcobacter sp.]|nr:UDP-4-amino-4,6-dideoxy-N-acetyl-beta-L-altrosamine N-acetyltransferase [Aliarcobacter sp.]
MKIVFKNFIFLNDIEKKDILELRNKEYVRENMINSEPISLENHILFIESLKNKNKTYFAIFFDNQLIGSLNIIKNEELIWGLYFKE